jgi:hypothetical protein
LFTKLDCHLCEEAYHMLMDVAFDIPLKIDVVDITLPHNRSFWEQYSERIPVIAKPDVKTELAWPFTSEDLKAFLTGESGLK